MESFTKKMPLVFSLIPRMPLYLSYIINSQITPRFFPNCQKTPCVFFYPLVIFHNSQHTYPFHEREGDLLCFLLFAFCFLGNKIGFKIWKNSLALCSLLFAFCSLLFAFAQQCTFFCLYCWERRAQTFLFKRMRMLLKHSSSQSHKQRTFFCTYIFLRA